MCSYTETAPSRKEVIGFFHLRRKDIFGSPKWSGVVKAHSLWDQELVEVGIDED